MTSEESTPILTQTNNNTPRQSDRMWVSDTNITRISEMVFRQQQKDRENAANAGDDVQDTPQYGDPAFNHIPPSLLLSAFVST